MLSGVAWAVAGFHHCSPFIFFLPRLCVKSPSGLGLGLRSSLINQTVGFFLCGLLEYGGGSFRNNFPGRCCCCRMSCFSRLELQKG